MEKSILELKAEFLYLCVSDKKIISFEISVIIFMAYECIRNVKMQNFFSFFLYFRDCPKNDEGSKQRRRRKYMRKSN